MLQAPAGECQQSAPIVSQTPPAECHRAVQAVVQRVQRRVTAQRQKKVKVSGVVEGERAARLQEMIATHEQALKRLRMGRLRALESERAFIRMRKKDALEYAKSSENSRRVFAHLKEVERRKHRELQEWVESIKNRSRETSEKLQQTSEMKASMDRTENVGRPELAYPAPHYAKQDGAESSSRAFLPGEKSGKEGTGLIQSDTSCSENGETVGKYLEQTNAAGVAGPQNEQVWILFPPYKDLICFYNFSYLSPALSCNKDEEGGEGRGGEALGCLDN